MNQVRRKSINKAIDLVKDAVWVVEGVLDDEQQSLNNMPENLEASERCLAMENAIDNLTDAVEQLNDAVESLNRAVE